MSLLLTLNNFEHRASDIFADLEQHLLRAEEIPGKNYLYSKIPEAHSEHYQTSKMECMVILVTDFQQLTIF